MQVQVAWSDTILLCTRKGSPRIIGVQRFGDTRAQTVLAVHSPSRDITANFTYSVNVVLVQCFKSGSAKSTVSGIGRQLWWSSNLFTRSAWMSMTWAPLSSSIDKVMGMETAGPVTAACHQKCGKLNGALPHQSLLLHYQTHSQEQKTPMGM